MRGQERVFQSLQSRGIVFFVEKLKKNNGYLKEDGEEDDRDGGGDEERLVGDAGRIDRQDQREGDGAAQAAVRHDELLHRLQLVQAKPVGYFRQQNDAWRDPQTDTITHLPSSFCLTFKSIHLAVSCFRPGLTQDPVNGAKKDGQADEGRVPGVVVVHRVDAQKDEDDRLRRVAQHLHRLDDRRVGLGWNVRLHVVLHRDAAKHDPVGRKANEEDQRNLAKKSG